MDDIELETGLLHLNDLINKYNSKKSENFSLTLDPCKMYGLRFTIKNKIGRVLSHLENEKTYELDHLIQLMTSIMPIETSLLVGAVLLEELTDGHFLTIEGCTFEISGSDYVDLKKGLKGKLL